MMFIAGVALSALLCADAVLAGVAQDRGIAARLARRVGRRSAPFKNNTSHATVQSNWGGAILEGSGYTAASATVNVPQGGGGSSAAGSAWVGIDGATCDSAILQTGFDWYGDGTYDAWLQNLSTGQKVTQTFSRVTAGSLCETSAEFIIEDFEECSSNGSNCQAVPFASFSPAVKFSSASATHNGQAVSLSGAVLSQVIVNNQDLTKCSVSGSTLTCSYV